MTTTMSDYTIHEIPSEQLNPNDNDLFEVDHYTGSVWQTLSMKFSTFYTYIKNKLLATGNALTIKTYIFTEADYFTYEPSQYQMVLYVNAKFTTATSIKIGTLTDPEAYIAETSNTSSNIGLYCDSSNASERSINISLNGSGIVTIISIKNV